MRTTTSSGEENGRDMGLAIDPSTPAGAATIVALDASGYEAAIPELAALLVDAVAHGAGVNFVAPLDPEVAARWWHDRVELVRRGAITAIGARAHVAGGGRLVGCVLLILAAQ